MFVQPKYTFWKVILFPLKCHTVMRVIFAVIIYTSKVCLCVCVCVTLVILTLVKYLGHMRISHRFVTMTF